MCTFVLGIFIADFEKCYFGILVFMHDRVTCNCGKFVGEWVSGI